jgi:hypothetical protein
VLSSCSHETYYRRAGHWIKRGWSHCIHP